MSSGNRQVNMKIELKMLWAFFSLADARTIYCFLWICSYVHRVGRTARAGRKGYAVTFVTDNDRSLLKVIVSKSPDIVWILLLPISWLLEFGHFFQSKLFLWILGKEGGFKVKEPNHPRAFNRQVVSDNRWNGRSVLCCYSRREVQFTAMQRITISMETWLICTLKGFSCFQSISGKSEL